MIKQANFNYIDAELRDFLGVPFKFDPANFGGVSSDLNQIEVDLIQCPNFDEWLDVCYEVGFATWGNDYEINLDEIRSDMTDEELRMRTLNFLKRRPISAALESAVFVFVIKGVPRTMTHQIVRHRFHSYNQQSYRVSPAHHADVRIPENTPPHHVKELDSIFNRLREIYVDMVTECADIPIEQARNILPMGTLTNITMTVTLKDLINYVKARTLGISQDEHTYIVMRLLNEMKISSASSNNFYESFIMTDQIDEMMYSYLQS